MSWPYDDFDDADCEHEAYLKGVRVGRKDMLDSIRASLRAYPNVGGDVEVMREVDRIVKAALDNQQKGS